MANSRYEYVKGFEQPDALLPQCWVVVRIDGKGFTKCEPCARAGMQSARRGGAARAEARGTASQREAKTLSRRLRPGMAFSPCWRPRFCEKHRFKKPNDERALRLMNAAAKARARASTSSWTRSCRRHSHSSTVHWLPVRSPFPFNGASRRSWSSLGTS